MSFSFYFYTYFYTLHNIPCKYIDYKIIENLLLHNRINCTQSGMLVGFLQLRLGSIGTYIGIP